MHPKGTPIIRATIVEKDPDTSAEATLDINNFAIVPTGDPKERAKMRRALLRYLELQVDNLLDGGSTAIRIERCTA